MQFICIQTRWYTVSKPSISPQKKNKTIEPAPFQSWALTDFQF